MPDNDGHHSGTKTAHEAGLPHDAVPYSKHNPRVGYVGGLLGSEVQRIIYQESVRS